ncbi:MAG: CoA transferase [Haliea sp.]|uniref:CaiB/BaiF CoA transferase family protein n=1 Tax=Marinobacter salarius TaxID=1420917 RepID=UPI0032EBA9BD
MENTKTLPLDGIRVVDFTQVMMGPSATQMLGDLGADVIKVENPKGGDLSRNSFGAKDEKGLNNPIFCSLNRNKRSLALDLKDPESREAVYSLIKTADVVVNNFRAGIMKKLGFDYETLKQINPAIIYASGSGYGSEGPYVHKGGQDVIAQAMSGVMSRRSDPSLPITIYATPLCDYTAGMHLVQSIMAALIARMKTGEGDCVEVSLYNSMIAMQMQEAAFQMYTGKEINWAEMPLTGVFETSDGALVLVGAFKKNPLQDISEVLGIEDLSERFPELQSQRDAKPYLHERFGSEFAKNSTAYWIEKLEGKDLLCAPVKTLEETLEDEQTRVNQMITSIDHPLNGPMRLVGSPIKFTNVDFRIRHNPPRIGEHNAEILRELGIETREES